MCEGSLDSIREYLVFPITRILPIVYLVALLLLLIDVYGLQAT